MVEESKITADASNFPQVTYQSDEQLSSVNRVKNSNWSQVNKNKFVKSGQPQLSQNSEDTGLIDSERDCKFVNIGTMSQKYRFPSDID